MNSLPIRDAAASDTSRSTPAPAENPGGTRESDLEHGLVRPTRRAHHPALALADAPAEKQRDRGRNERDREHERRGECEDDRDRHRPEQLPLDAAQREDRHVHDHDDHDPEDARPDHLSGGARDDVEPLAERKRSRATAVLFGQSPDAVLDDDHGPIHDQAEIERTQAHQVRADLGASHAGEGEQHRQRNHERREERGACVSEQREENRDHEQRALDEVPLHRRDRAIDERGAIVDGPHRDAGREVLADLRELRTGALRDGPAVLADQHEDRAEHRLATVLGRRTGAKLAAECDLGDVGHADRNPTRVPHHHPAHVVEIAKLTRRPNQDLLAVALDVAGAGAEAVLRDRPEEVAERQPVRDEPFRARRDVHLLHEPADAVHLRDAANGAKLRLDHPVLQRPQVGGIERAAALVGGAGCKLHGVHEDLAEARRDRPERGLDSLWKSRHRLAQALVHELAREVDVGAVLEDDRDL